MLQNQKYYLIDRFHNQISIKLANSQLLHIALINVLSKIRVIQVGKLLQLIVDSVRMDFQLDQKISKRRFFQDIKNSFQWVIGNGLKPTQFFSFQNISTNTVAREVQSFGRNGPWLAGWLSSDQNFCANLAQTCDEHMLKISKQYLDSYLNYC